VYVDPHYRRRGYFKALYQHVKECARRDDAVGIRLYVDVHNVKAQATVSMTRSTRQFVHSQLSIDVLQVCYVRLLSMNVCTNLFGGDMTKPCVPCCLQYKSLGMSSHYLVYEDISMSQ
jgi:hypothetical protein